MPAAPSTAFEHFGELVRPGKYGLRLTREMYALVNKKSSTRIPEHMLTDEVRAHLAPHYEDAALTIHTDEYCRRQREMALENFDLNMAYFASIPPESFEDALEEMLRKHKRMRPVTDLKKLDGEWGAYLLVLVRSQACSCPRRRRCRCPRIPQRRSNHTFLPVPGSPLVAGQRPNLPVPGPWKSGCRWRRGRFHPLDD